MFGYFKVLELHASGMSIRKIAHCTGMARNTVSKIVRKVEREPPSEEFLSTCTERELKNWVNKAADRPVKERRMPDFDKVHGALKKVHGTLLRQWQLYKKECEADCANYYEYARFCQLYHEYAESRNLTAPLIHKPGNEVMVDWAGKTLQIFEAGRKRPTKITLFVGVLPFSMKCFVYACRSMKEEEWIDCHVRMYEYFGGVTNLAICDNTKTAVISHGKYEDPVLNRVYQEMAAHYGTAILPARVVRPRDKAAVESSVNTITTKIVAELQDEMFTDLAALNDAVRKKNEEINETPFQKRPDSRNVCFEIEEKEFLSPLPDEPYVCATWETHKVHPNCHVQVRRQYYSVPYRYAGKKVSVRIGKDTVQIWYDGLFICEHALLVGRPSQYATVLDHMHPRHQTVRNWSVEYFEERAEKIGPSTTRVVEIMLRRKDVPEQAYKSVNALIHLSKNFPHANLESACTAVLSQTSAVTLSAVKTMMQEMQKRAEDKSKENSTPSYAFVRGEAYYGKGPQE